jgi:glycosyltransferase involved in cell wall biosynthesis
VKLLLKERRDVKLLLAGEGEAEADLRARVPDELRAHFIFAGKVPHDEVRDYYSVMDVLVYPRVKSRLTELTTPLKPLEAMAMARVVVGSEVGGISELVQNGVTGFLVEAGSAPALAQCLAQLTTNESARREVGQQARQFVVRERAWEQIVKRYQEVYRSEQ